MLYAKEDDIKKLIRDIYPRGNETQREIAYKAFAKILEKQVFRTGLQNSFDAMVRGKTALGSATVGQETRDMIAAICKALHTLSKDKDNRPEWIEERDIPAILQNIETTEDLEKATKHLSLEETDTETLCKAFNGEAVLQEPQSGMFLLTGDKPGKIFVFLDVDFKGGPLVVEGDVLIQRTLADTTIIATGNVEIGEADSTISVLAGGDVKIGRNNASCTIFAKGDVRAGSIESTATIYSENNVFTRFADYRPEICSKTELCQNLPREHCQQIFDEFTPLLEQCKETDGFKGLGSMLRIGLTRFGLHNYISHEDRDDKKPEPPPPPPERYLRY